MTFANRNESRETRNCWGCMTMPCKNPLRPVFTEDSMVIRSCDITPTYQLPHLYLYWKQRTSTYKIKSEFFYQFNRPLLQKMPPGFFSDVILLVGGREFKVHRVILGLASEYFRALFSNMKESRELKIEIKEVDPDTFSTLIDLIYGHKIQLSGLNTVWLLSAVKRFCINEISDREIEEMIEVLDIKSEDPKGPLEFIEASKGIYGGEHSSWLIGHFFNYITPQDEIKFKELFPKLPQSFQVYFNENYEL